MTSVAPAPTAHGLDEDAFAAALTLIADRAADHDRAGGFPFAAFEALRAIGAPALTVPVEFGGAVRDWRKPSR